MKPPSINTLRKYYPFYSSPRQVINITIIYIDKY
jgi:hypothetical protein